MNLVNSQQTRRLLDRIVGYKISPLLWKTVKSGLSAGRVQSVATRIIVEREHEINAFVPVEYWTIEADLKNSEGKTISVRFYGDENGKLCGIFKRHAAYETSGGVENSRVFFESFLVGGVKRLKLFACTVRTAVIYKDHFVGEVVLRHYSLNPCEKFWQRFFFII